MRGNLRRTIGIPVSIRRMLPQRFFFFSPFFFVFFPSDCSFFSFSFFQFLFLFFFKGQGKVTRAAELNPLELKMLWV
jgi:hypothetical protein